MRCNFIIFLDISINFNIFLSLRIYKKKVEEQANKSREKLGKKKGKRKELDHIMNNRFLKVLS